VTGVQTCALPISARKNLQQAKEEQTKANSNLENAKKQLDETKAKVEQVKAQFTEALSSADFSTEEMYQQAKLPENERQVLKQDTETFKQKLTTTRQQVQELQASLKDKQKVDLTALEQQLAELKKAYETALNQRDQSKKYYQEATALIKNISNAHEKVGAS